ncbi:DUF4397 domain-containing protein [Pedobacter sp. HMWF019]|uniref:DUF4397 domain-containing protein n=1 Tax=Pedobacter sp. HMWF019 TaxID=2056856 RepID=UPI000D38EE79|nr:DUF4397 domain-containing protein [Pedobacter sp. HMWF019]PTS97145.1 DUF4397 domain-containing protein [Pedobacter sp. HMWF019]
MMKEIKQSKNSLLLTFSMLLLLVSCKKEKQNVEYDNRPVTDGRKSSTVRVVNLGSYNQVQVNGDTLTNYVVRTVNDPMTGKYPGTKYFPENGRLGVTWNIPQDLLKQGKASLLVEERSYGGLNSKATVDVAEDASQPMDYYFTQSTAEIGIPDDGRPLSRKFKRDITAPANPASFKIRIINLSAPVNHTQGEEDLVGPMSLAWADGTLVNQKTSQILPGTASDYIEVPYGTIQFKVLSKAGTEVSAIFNGLIEPNTSQIINEMTSATPRPDIELTYAPMKTYAPGGVYTIVISPSKFRIPYRFSNTGEELSVYQNAFRLITDVAEPLNTTYSKMQGIHALAGTDQIKLLCNGQALGATIPYGGHSEEQTLITGNYKIDAVNATGTVLATTDLKLEAHTNLSLWVCRDAKGQAKISVVANDMSGRFNIGGSDDATNSGYLQQFPVSVRFLNRSNLPYLTFTTNNGQDFGANYAINPAAVNNLTPGSFPTENPYVSLYRDSNPYKFMAYRSSPSTVPGVWADDIPVLTGQNLIARPELYVRGLLPNHESGIYTIALIGSVDPSAPVAQRAKMIVLKHNK